MPDMAGLLGLPQDFEWEGRTYKVAPFDFGLRSMAAHWVADEALRGIQAHADSAGPQMLGVLIESWVHTKAAKLFSPGSFIVERALSQEEGLKHRAYLQLGRLNKGFQRSQVDRIWADPLRRRELVVKMYETSGEEPPEGHRADPNARAGEEGPPSGSPSPEPSTPS